LLKKGRPLVVAAVVVVVVAVVVAGVVVVVVVVVLKNGKTSCKPSRNFCLFFGAASVSAITRARRNFLFVALVGTIAFLNVI
jgi:branched-subunit amino acid transport protein AzlD